MYVAPTNRVRSDYRMSCEGFAPEEVLTWHFSTHCTSKANNVDEDTSYVSCVSTPRDAPCIPIGSSLLRGVEIPCLQVSFADEVVVRNHDSSNRGQKDAVC